MDEILHLLIGPVFHLIDLRTRADLFVLLAQHVQLSQVVLHAQLKENKYAKEEEEQNAHHAHRVDESLAIEDRRRNFDILRGLSAPHGQRIHERHYIKKLERRQECPHQQRLFRVGNILIIKDLKQNTKARRQHCGDPEVITHAVDEIDQAIYGAQ